MLSLHDPNYTVKFRLHDFHLSRVLRIFFYLLYICNFILFGSWSRVLSSGGKWVEGPGVRVPTGKLLVTFEGWRTRERGRVERLDGFVVTQCLGYCDYGGVG
jgi:hypothetical protein